MHPLNQRAKKLSQVGQSTFQVRQILVVITQLVRSGVLKPEVALSIQLRTITLSQAHSNLVTLRSQLLRPTLHSHLLIIEVLRSSQLKLIIAARMHIKVRNQV